MTADGITIGAIVAVNCLGSPVVPGGRRFWAGAFEIGDEFGGLGAGSDRVAPEDWGLAKINPALRSNTTIACVATDVALDPDELKRGAGGGAVGARGAGRDLPGPSGRRCRATWCPGSTATGSGAGPGW